MSAELIPMLLLSLLLLSAEGVGGSAEVLLSGRHVAGDGRALIVGDAELTVPDGATVSGPVHVIGGDVVIDGSVGGDVRLIAGTLVVGPSGRIEGTLHHIGGTAEVAPSAVVGRRTEVGLVPDRSSGAGRFVPLVGTTVLLSGIGAWTARRRPDALRVVGTAVRGHPVVCLTVGGLVTVTAIALFVFMAFTLVLIPVSLLGAAGGLVVLAYAVIALGALVGRGLPLRGAGATAAGVAVVVVSLQLLGGLAVIGDLVVGGLLLTGLGAVLLTYFGLQPFSPARIPD